MYLFFHEDPTLRRYSPTPEHMVNMDEFCFIRLLYILKYIHHLRSCSYLRVASPPFVESRLVDLRRPKQRTLKRVSLSSSWTRILICKGPMDFWEPENRDRAVPAVLRCAIRQHAIAFPRRLFYEDHIPMLLLRWTSFPRLALGSSKTSQGCLSIFSWNKSYRI